MNEIYAGEDSAEELLREDKLRGEIICTVIVFFGVQNRRTPPTSSEKRRLGNGETHDRSKLAA